MGTTFPTRWPENLETEELSFIASAADVVNCDERETVLHKHRTGQITLAVQGQVNIQLEKEVLAVPVRSVVWVPAGVLHSGELAPGAESVFFMVNANAELVKKLPKKPARLMINTMTYEMIRYFAQARPEEVGRHHYEAIAKVILEQLTLAQSLPVSFAPVPNHPILRKLVEEFSKKDNTKRTNAEWAESVHMTERTLSRLVLKETGLSFKRWRLHLTLLESLPMVMEKVNIGTIAQRCGYETTSSFIAAFKNVFGMTPGQLRQTNTLKS